MSEQLENLFKGGGREETPLKGEMSREVEDDISELKIAMESLFTNDYEAEKQENILKKLQEGRFFKRSKLEKALKEKELFLNQKEANKDKIEEFKKKCRESGLSEKDIGEIINGIKVETINDLLKRLKEERVVDIKSVKLGELTLSDIVEKEKRLKPWERYLLSLLPIDISKILGNDEKIKEEIE